MTLVKSSIYILLISILLTVFFVSRVNFLPGSHNDISRLAGIISVARYNRLNIDNTIQEEFTVDKVQHNEQFFSSKPPTLNFLGGIITKTVFQVKPVLLENDVAIYRFNTILFVVLPLILIFILFFYLLSTEDNKIKTRYYFYALYLILGTLLFSYSRHLNNHIVVALLQLATFVLLFKKDKEKGNLCFLLLGLTLGLMVSFDITFSFVSVPITLVFMYILHKPNIKNLFYLIMGSFPFIFLHFYLNYIQFDTLFPPQLFPDKYLAYEGSNWLGLDTDGIEATNHNIFLRTFNYTFGTYGLFLYQPILLIPFFRRKNWRQRNFQYVLLILIGVLIFNVITTPNYGGSSFGPRRFIPLIPLLFYFVVYTIENSKSRNFLIKFLIVILFIVNWMFSYLGYINTWETWNYFPKEDGRQLFFPLLFTIRKILRWHNLDYLLLYIIN